MDHHRFIARTDKKSLFNQIKFLVTCGQDSYHNDLILRRNRIRELLENDDKIYENEFIGKIKSRVDENIRQRQESLLAMKRERTREIEKFVAEKKLHQNMTNCIEIREELRRKDNMETQLCQLEQMDDKLRAIAKEQKDEEFWLKVQERITNDIDAMQEREGQVKRHMQANQCKILHKQLEDHRHVHEMDVQHSNNEKAALDQRINESVRKEKEKAAALRIARNRDVKESVNRICEQRKLLEQEAETFEEVFHEESMRQVRLEIEKERQKNAGLKEAVLDYLTYLRKFRVFVEEEEARRDEAFEQVGKRFYCMKTHPKRVAAAKKREAAEACYKVLLKQICEEQERRAELEAYEKENKIIENRFARPEIRDKIKQRAEIKRGLDMQLERLAQIRAEEQMKFSQELNRAAEDRIYCEQLLKKHKADGCDYLVPHPNWKLLACYKGDSFLWILNVKLLSRFVFGLAVFSLVLYFMLNIGKTETKTKKKTEL